MIRVPGQIYRDSIASATGCTSDTARLVYALMLTEHGTLDALSAPDFDHSALLSLAEVEQDRATAERVAQSWGL